jgi:hypothetical protein
VGEALVSAAEDARARCHVWTILMGCDWRFRRTPHGFVIHRSFKWLKRWAARNQV